MADIRVLEVPKWGLSMEEGTINDWLIAVGDRFKEGQEICEIETSKIVNVLEAPFSGTLRKVLAQPGITLPVQAPIGLCAGPDISDAAIEQFAASLGGSADDAAAETATQEVQDSNSKAVVSVLDDEAGKDRPCKNTTGKDSVAEESGNQRSSNAIVIPDALQQGADDSQVFATLHARKLAKNYGINLNQVNGSGRRGRISVKDIKVAIIGAGGSVPASPKFPTKLSMSAVSVNHADDKSVKATPLARRLAKQLGINLHDCRVSGSRGRVSKADVEAQQARIEQSQSADTEVPVPAVAHTFDAEVPAPAKTAPAKTLPISSMRRTIGTRLQQSKQASPHFRVALDCNLDALLATRREVNTYHAGAKVSVNDFVLKAAAMALVKVPECNIQFDGNAIQQFDDVDIAIAVALADGLITPLVRRANYKTLVEISNEARSLVTKAKANTLKPEEFQGGTFTVSNLGMFGVKQFDAIINPPQAAILAVGGAEQRVIVKDGAPAVATMMTVNLSADHRVIDGALSARFLQAFKQLIETPILMMA